MARTITEYSRSTTPGGIVVADFERATPIAPPLEACSAVELLRDLVDNAPIATLAWRNRQIICVNRMFAHVFGLERPAVAEGRPVAEYLLGVSDAGGANGETVEADTLSTDSEATGVRDDGSRFPVRLIVSHADLVGGRFFLGCCTDLTESRLAEESLRRTQFSIDKAADLVYWIDKHGRLVDASASTINRLGFSRDELLSMNLTDFTVGVTRDAWWKTWQAAKTGSQRVERELRAKDGHTFPVAITVNYVVFEGREYNCVFAHDLSEHKEAEAKIRHLSFFPELNPEPVLEFDREGGVLYANPAAEAEAKRLGLDGLRAFLPLDGGELRSLMSRTTESHFCREVSISGEVFAETLSYLPDWQSVRVFARNITEEKQIRDELQLTQLAVDCAADLIHWIDAEGRIIFANEASCRRDGYSQEEMLSLRIADIDPTYTPELWKQQWQKVKSAGSLTVESLHRSKGGELYPVEVAATYMEQGETAYIFAFVRDISERKRVEEALRSSEGRYQTLVNLSPDAIIVNADGKHVFANPAAARLFGAESPEQLVGRDALDMIHPDYREQVSRRVAQDLAGLEAIPQSIKIVRVDGTAVEVESMGARIEFDGKAATQVVFRDITERKQMEESLRLTQLSVDSALDMVAWIGTDGHLLYVNDAFCRRHGYAREELLNMSIFDLDPCMPVEAWRDRWNKEKEQGAVAFEVTHRSKDGEVFPLEVVSHFIERDGEEINVGIARDMTERKKAEAALRESEEQLRQSQKMEAVGQLAGGIAHDFNNALTAIIGYSDLILASRECSDSILSRDVHEIKKAAERAGALTWQILAFSRRQALQPEVISLNQVVESTERLLRRTLGENIDLLPLLLPDLGLVEVDPHQMEQVLLNLALNARDAMPSGGKLILQTTNMELNAEHCQADSGITPGSFVALKVSDTGVGMDEATRSRAFEPFFTTKEAGKGTGLGLSTVYGIVKQSGGSISLQSELGGGTTFTIYLPRVDGPVEVRAGAFEARLPQAGKETILVVEDEAAVRQFVGRALESLGYTVSEASTGDEAVATLARKDLGVDLLLTDVVLPGTLQGHELARAAATLRPQLPILYMSGYTRNAVVHSGRLDHGIHYLAKPFTPEKLVRKVREVLDSRSALT